jgi:hypothetical protein
MRYKKKPVEIEAVQFDGTSTSKVAIRQWMDGEEYFKPMASTRDITTLTIETLEGPMTAQPGDFIIKGIQGEFYPCKPDIFEQSYDPVPAPLELDTPEYDYVEKS